jgi:hypothetical protein
LGTINLSGALVAVSNITELAQSLSENERKALLERIQKSLQIHKSNERDIFHQESNEKERELFIFQDKNRMGIWERIVLWFKGIFSPKSKTEVFIEYKLEQIQKRLDGRSQKIIDSAKRELPAEFARNLFKLYSHVNLLFIYMSFFGRILNIYDY